LALYVGGKQPNKEHIYIAILGQVFDVSKAPQFYSGLQMQLQLMYDDVLDVFGSRHCCMCR
jgi:predicted heme/steroid binding protein